MAACCIAIVGAGHHCREVIRLVARSGITVRVVPWHAHDGRRGLWPVTPNVEVHGDLGAVYECDVVISCVPGSADAQRAALAAIEPRLSSGAILAIATDRASLGELTSELARPAQAVGIHFPRPLDAWDTVELEAIEETAPGVMLATTHLCRQLGRQPVQPMADAAE